VLYIVLASLQEIKFLEYVFTLSAYKMAMAIAYQKSIFTKKPVAVPILDLKLFIFVKIFELCLVTQSV